MKKRLLSLALAVSLFAGCEPAEEKEYDTVYKEPEQIQRSAVDTSKVYLYVPSTGAAPRFARSQNPFYQGIEKLVYLEYQEDGIYVCELDHDATKIDADGNINLGRFSSDKPVDDGNCSNNSFPVLKLPGKYQEYQCSEDSYGECSNKEEEKTDTTWDKKQYFTPDYEGLKTYEKNTIDLWFKHPALAETDVRALNFEVTDGLINIELERTYSVSTSSLGLCLDKGLISELSGCSFRSNFFYSLVDINKLASKDYKAIHYAQTDHDTFGYFKSEQNKIDDTFNPGRNIETTYFLNRFNPEKTQIFYHLSDTFNKPENKIYKDATKNVIAKLNEQFKMVGVPDIVLVEPSGKHSGDLRYNMINLIDDPLANGLLGYGPSVSHPLTGEILKAHVNQYSGVARTGARRTWNRMVTLYNRGDMVLDPTADTPANNINFAEMEEISSNTLSNYDGDYSPESFSESLTNKNITDAQRLNIPEEFIKVLEEKSVEEKHGLLEKELPVDLDEIEKMAYEDQKRLQYWSENNAFGEEAYWISSTSKRFIPGLQEKAYLFVDTNKTKLKSWEELSDDQKKEVTDIITVHVYNTTLVHELGHNLGLRHNFKGTLDAANFYTPKDLNETSLRDYYGLGAKPASNQAPVLGYPKEMTSSPSSSSIMDYHPSELDSLSLYGKYDLAALRFGYKRELEVINGASDIVGYVSLLPYDELYVQKVKDATGDEVAPYGVFEFLKHFEGYSEAIYDLQRKTTEMGDSTSDYNAKNLLLVAEKEKSDPSNDVITDLEKQLKTLKARYDDASADYIKASEKLEIETVRANNKLNIALASHSASFAPAMKGNFQAMSRGKIKEYKYCTDGNVSLNSDCNRFDEGTNLYEIALYRIQQLRDLHDRLNFRDQRKDYWEHNMPGLISYKLRKYSELRDLVEDFEQLEDLFNNLIGHTISSYSCTPDELDASDDFTYSWLCDEVLGAKAAASYLMEVAMEPDHTCEIRLTSDVTDDRDPANLKTVFNNGEVMFVTLSKIFNDVKYSLEPGYLAPKSCFDPAIKSYLNGDFDSKFQLSKNYGLFNAKAEVLSESGRYLNGFNNYDPEHKYSNERAVMGTWPDKLIAMRLLASRETRRRTADETFFSMLHIKPIREQFEMMLDHMAFGTELTSAAEFKPVFKNEQGQPVETKSAYSFDRNQTIEEMPYYDYNMRRFFQLQRDGETNLLKAMLAQVSRYGKTDAVSGEKASKEIVDYVSVKDYSVTFEQQSAKKVVYEGEVYQATEENKIAYPILEEAAAMNAFIDAQVTTGLAQTFYNQRTAAVAPANRGENVLLSTGDGIMIDILAFCQANNYIYDCLPILLNSNNRVYAESRLKEFWSIGQTIAYSRKLELRNNAAAFVAASQAADGSGDALKTAYRQPVLLMKAYSEGKLGQNSFLLPLLPKQYDE